MLKKVSIFHSFILSYLLLSIIIGIVNIPFASYTNSKIISQNQVINEYILSETKQVFDSYFNNLRSVSYSLAYSNVLSSIPVKEAYTSRDYYNSINVSQYIADLLKANASVENVAGYWPAQDIVISSEGIVTGRQYFQMVYGVEAESEFLRWRQEVCGEKDYFVYDYVNDFGEPNSKLVCSLKLTNRSASRGQLVAFSEMKPNAFQERIKDVFDKTGGNIVAFGNGRQDLIFNGQEREKMLRILEGREDDTYVTTLGQGADAGWQYGIIFERSKYLESMKYVYRMLLLNLLLGLLFVLCFAYYFSKRQYQPIKNLVDKISHAMQVETAGPKVNELTYVEEQMEQLIHDKNLFESISKKNSNVLRVKILTNLLEGQYTSEDIALFEEYYPRLRGEYFMACLIKPDGESIERLKQNGYSDGQIQTIFVNILDELVNDFCRGVALATEEGFCCILNAEAELVADEAKEIFLNAEQVIWHYFQASFYTAVGGCMEGYTGLVESFRQAKKTLYFMEVKEDERLISYDELEFDVADYNKSVGIKNQMIHYLKQGEDQKAYAVFEEMLSQQAMEDELQLKLIVYMSYVVSAVLPEDTRLADKFDPVRRFADQQSAAGLKTVARSYFKELCDALKKVKTNGKVEEICAYIQENYADDTLSVARVGEKFGLHPVYLSRLFKMEMKEGVWEYITRLRISHAKRLLVQTDKKLEAVARETGFASVDTFSRSFKKMQGVTPGAYRSSGLS